MTIEEQVSLLAGTNVWHTRPIERLGIPSMRVSDGPAGVRGARMDGPPSMNIPCSTGIGATWDRALVREIGELLGREMHAKGARVHLAPTVNLHRTPVGGRNFECMSEDPYLTAVTAREYVQGVQSEGVASCIKHLVGNDTEFERMTIDSQIDERTLREMYLLPFEMAVKDAGVMSVMSSYNRINGPYAADSHWLLQEVLRDEWGFDGAVISDWFGLHSTVEGVNAGCDLEMPGPPIHRGKKLMEAVEKGEVDPLIIRQRARNILNLLERTGALDTRPGEETSRHDSDDLHLLRRAASASMVLLKNENSALPLVTHNVKSVAILGPNAMRGTLLGGGSAHVTPTRTSHPYQALRSRFEESGVEVHHAPGCFIDKKLPLLDPQKVSDVVVEFFESPAAMDNDEAPSLTSTVNSFRMLWMNDPLSRKGSNFAFGARMMMVFTPDVSGEWEFGIESVGGVRVYLDDLLVLDNSHLPAGGSFYGAGKPELIQTTNVEAGRQYQLVIEIRHEQGPMAISGIYVGARAPVVGDPLRDAVDLAATCDVSVVVVGTNNDWESEGWDRADLTLPGIQDELVSEIAKVSKRTIVVVNAGSPVAMPWLNEVDAVVYAWFPGQEFGEALADVLFGEIEPSGRLPVTLPFRMEDTPAFEHHPGRNGEAKYLEGRLIGYRWYDTTGKIPLFPFGFGLGYADVSVESALASSSHHVSVALNNSSKRDGVQVVQVYAHQVERNGLPDDEPDQKLVGWVRVEVAAGSTASAEVHLDDYAFRTWDPSTRAWVQWSGDIELRIGTSSRHIAKRLLVQL